MRLLICLPKLVNGCSVYTAFCAITATKSLAYDQYSLAVLKYESRSIAAEVVDQIDDDAIRVEFDITRV